MKRSIVNNPACWGAWEEPGRPKAQSEAAAGEVVGPAVSVTKFGAEPHSVNDALHAIGAELSFSPWTIHDTTTAPGFSTITYGAADLTFSASTAFSGPVRVVLGSHFDVRLDHGDGYRLVACDIPMGAPRSEVVRQLRRFADAIEWGSGS